MSLLLGETTRRSSIAGKYPPAGAEYLAIDRIDQALTEESVASKLWHTLSAEGALSAAESRAAGLSDDEAASRLATYGFNRLTPPRPISPWKILRDQLSGVVVVLLFAAALISLLLGDVVEAIAIAAVLVINTVIGFATEWRARRAMEALRQLDVPRATVVRSGHVQLIDAERLVPGDLVEIAAGHSVPADVRLLTSIDLRINEAALTGESLPVSKTAALVLEADTDLAERVNMAFKGTTVAAGFGRALVIGTGSATEVGRIGEMAGAVDDEPTPLEQRLDALGRRLVWVTIGIAAVVGLLGALQGASTLLVVETAIALAVAAVPEALPAVATIALAVGMRRMARRHALVRRLPAVETLGSTTVVCTDKTRTLTSGDMAVVRVWAAGREWDPLDVTVEPDRDLTSVLQGAALASRAQVDDASLGALRDPVDAAILEGAERLPATSRVPLDVRQVGMIPFASSRKWMAGFYQTDEAVMVFVKGAPRAILERSTAALTPHGLEVLDETARKDLMRANDHLAADGLRVLGVASGSVSHTAEEAVQSLTFLGFLGLADPPAAGVRETIAQLRAAGLRTVMLTGDQRLTAAAVGRSVGLLSDSDASMDGRELERLDAAGRAAAIARTSVFSRVTPEHKLIVVRALQASGEIVAMLGDGINDAAALKKADVGVAMGIRGTDIAKDAASIVLQDDRFETVAAAVEEGRVIFDNIRKFVFYLFSCNVAEILVLLGAGLAALPLPLAPLQLLWLNMVTDTFPALALALEPGERNVMHRPPRDPQAAILSRRFLLRVAGYGLLITASTMTAYVWALAEAPARATTIAFMTLALAQVVHLGNARSNDPVFSPRVALSNPFALLGVALALALQALAAFFTPLGDILGVVPLEPRDWLFVVGLGSLPGLIGQLIKATRREPEW
jgi:Ca2+-transporting ATPase